MPRYAIVIKDADVAHAQEVRRNIEANIAHHGEQHRQRIEAIVNSRFPYGPRPAGTVHDEASSECPDGLPNCRNCGDSAYAETCKASGHCPNCGTNHGLAPDAVVSAHGYELKAI